MHFLSASLPDRGGRHDGRSAESALLVLRAASIDVIVVDLKLPRLNGLELLAHTPTRPRAPIAVTAFDDVATRDRALTGVASMRTCRSPSSQRRLVQEIARQLGSQD